MSHDVGHISECNSTYPVYNIEKISMNKILPKFTFTVGSDHSKWAINLGQCEVLHQIENQYLKQVNLC